MTTISISISELDDSGYIPGTGFVRLRLLNPVIGDTIVTTTTFTSFLDEEGEATITVPDELVGQAFALGVPGIRTRFYVVIPEDDVTLSELIQDYQVDPASLEPAAYAPLTIQQQIADLQEALNSLELDPEVIDAAIADYLAENPIEGVTETELNEAIEAIELTPGPAGADGADGADGTDGREVELQKGSTHIQWRYVGESTWTDLVALSAITGPAGADGSDGAEGSPGADGSDGREVELQKGATHIQWRYVDDVSWTDLVALADLKGADGTDGTDGEDGADGAKGDQGDPGINVEGFTGTPTLAKVTQAAYDAIVTKDANTIYYIVG